MGTTFVARYTFEDEWETNKEGRIKELTYPYLSAILLVNFILWNEMVFCVHCAPVLGESGCM